jgi:hypothetical protein
MCVLHGTDTIPGVKPRIVGRKHNMIRFFAVFRPASVKSPGCDRIE